MTNDIQRIDALPQGSAINSYVVERVLGSGAFGVTYLVRHRHLGSLHVIKEYLPDCGVRENNRSTVSPKSASDKELFDWGLKCFFDEAKLLYQLSHPHVVKVTDLFDANGTAYFVMPYLQGVTLHEWMKQHPNPIQSDLEAIFVPLLEGLKYIHDIGLLHRDIKPENIYITDNTNPVLIDFGSARIAIGQKSKALTQILTPHFAPIEQYRSKGTFTPALDLYGIAACLYQAITGNLPEEAPNRLEGDAQPKLAGSKYEKSYAPHFLQAIDKSLGVYSKDRHQNGFEFQKDLLGVNNLHLNSSTSDVLYEDGSKYVGEMKDGKPHGKGTYTFPDGENYVGEFKNGNYHGKGTWKHPNGQEYVGEFKDDKKHGRGNYLYSNGHTYVGEYREGKKHGQGTYYGIDGNVVYAGEWIDGKSKGFENALKTKKTIYNNQFIYFVVFLLITLLTVIFAR